MKDIQREVKALELAMEVATDIQDKSYAYAVTRIQEAILGNSSSSEEVTGDGNWYAFFDVRGVTQKCLRLVNTRGHEAVYLLPISTKIPYIKEFVAAFSSGNEKVRGTWQVNMPDSGAAYLRHSAAEIPLGAISKGTVERRILTELSVYLAYCGRL